MSVLSRAEKEKFKREVMKRSKHGLLSQCPECGRRFYTLTVTGVETCAKCTRDMHAAAHLEFGEPQGDLEIRLAREIGIFPDWMHDGKATL